MDLETLVQIVKDVKKDYLDRGVFIGPVKVAISPDSREKVYASSPMVYYNKEYYVDFFKGFGLKYWRDVYNIDVSQQSINELADCLFLDFNKEEPYEGIIFYKPFFNLDKDEQKMLVAHELWHYVEYTTLSEENIFPLIVEGTAEFAKDYINQVNSSRMDKPNTIIDFTYKVARDAVADIMFNSKRSLKDLFNINCRKEINARLLELGNKIIPSLGYNFSGLDKINFDIVFQLSKPEILQHYKDIGAKNIAAEIKNQELNSLLVNYFESLFYS
jgi:hypothetical protein